MNQTLVGQKIESVQEGDEFIANVAKSYNDMGETPLLVAIKNRTSRTVKFLVNKLKVSVIEVGPFTWENVDYTDVPPLFAAVISNQLPIINFLVDSEQYNPPVDLSQHPLILSSQTTRLQKISILELIGAAYIFVGTRASFLHGYSCWMRAFLLRQSTTDGGCYWVKGRNFCCTQLVHSWNSMVFYEDLQTRRNVVDRKSMLIDDSSTETR
ncbi:hypothetical protein OUZ56_021418 [Daphnia magna]|uniref:Ankyrin repeat domain-containing protein 54 n=1 Tax=Daphnia magna TaxID=35525 RepID=A0ABQ9ZHB2_9CRUS|nr:hypothetical protein OUZ56_021418 [Daphnia magna]